jgi:predicted RNase H-like HicB family nuclease
MNALKVVYEPDEDGWWTARIPSVKGVLSDGRTIAEARRRVRQALALAEDEGWSDEKAARVKLVDDVHLPAAARKCIEDRSKAVSALMEAAELVDRATSRAIAVLSRDTGRSLRDIAALLDLSHSRVHQILMGEERKVRIDRRSTGARRVIALPVAAKRLRS